jgi:hypothetical protein
VERKHLVPLIAAEALAVVVGGIWLVGQAANGDAETERQGIDIDRAVTATAVSSAQDITASSTVVITTTPPGQEPAEEAPAAPEPPQQQPVPVDEAPAPTGEPGNLLTTTTVATTTRVPDMPWCYDPNGKGWYSGAGEGCHEGGPHFVEYR